MVFWPMVLRAWTVTVDRRLTVEGRVVWAERIIERDICADQWGIGVGNGSVWKVLEGA